MPPQDRGPRRGGSLVDLVSDIFAGDNQPGEEKLVERRSNEAEILQDPSAEDDKDLPEPFEDTDPLPETETKTMGDVRPSVDAEAVNAKVLSLMKRCVLSYVRTRPLSTALATLESVVRKLTNDEAESEEILTELRKLENGSVNTAVTEDQTSPERRGVKRTRSGSVRSNGNANEILTDLLLKSARKTSISGVGSVVDSSDGEASSGDERMSAVSSLVKNVKVVLRRLSAEQIETVVNRRREDRLGVTNAEHERASPRATSPLPVTATASEGRSSSSSPAKKKKKRRVDSQDGDDESRVVKRDVADLSPPETPRGSGSPDSRVTNERGSGDGRRPSPKTSGGSQVSTRRGSQIGGKWEFCRFFDRSYCIDKEVLAYWRSHSCVCCQLQRVSSDPSAIYV